MYDDEYFVYNPYAYTVCYIILYYIGNIISAADKLLGDFRKGFLGYGSLEGTYIYLYILYIYIIYYINIRHVGLLLHLLY